MRAVFVNAAAALFSVFCLAAPMAYMLLGGPHA
jgi:hypothetical protein